MQRLGYVFRECFARFEVTTPWILSKDMRTFLGKIVNRYKLQQDGYVQILDTRSWATLYLDTGTLAMGGCLPAKRIYERIINAGWAA